MNKEYKRNKIRLLICFMTIGMTVVSWMISMTCMEGALSNLFIHLGHIIVASLAIYGFMRSFANMKKDSTIVFQPEIYKYYPEDKSKLSLDETMYYLHDKTIIKILYGMCLFFLGLFYIAIGIAFISTDGTTVSDVLVMHIVFIVLILLVSGFFRLILYVTRKNGAKYALNRNSRNYMNLGKDDYLEAVEKDLYRGMRFRSKRLILTEQFILGTIDRYTLSPIAIPVSLVRNIRYEVVYYGPTGNRYKDIKFYFDLTNGNTVLLYISYVECEIVAQMFKYYGFNIQ